MSMDVHENSGVAKRNEAIEVARFPSLGPASIELHNQDANAVCVVRIEKDSDGSALHDSAKDTVRTAEDTVYDGDGATLAFSGEVLNNLPVVPGTALIYNPTGSVSLQDQGDGTFHTVDVDDEYAGTIDYFTGALTLAYPAGKAPTAPGTNHIW